jgi:hypothetical protein
MALEKKEISMNRNIMLNLRKISYYLMTYGVNYKYYKSFDFSKGTLKNQTINHYGALINFLNRIFFLKNL